MERVSSAINKMHVTLAALKASVQRKGTWTQHTWQTESLQGQRRCAHPPHKPGQCAHSLVRSPSERSSPWGWWGSDREGERERQRERRRLGERERKWPCVLWSGQYKERNKGEARNREADRDRKKEKETSNSPITTLWLFHTDRQTNRYTERERGVRRKRGRHSQEEVGRATNTFSAQPWMQLPLDCKKWRGGGGQKKKASGKQKPVEGGKERQWRP